MRYAEIHRLENLDYQGTEAINTICSNLSFAGRDVKRIVLTSCNPNDGKSFLAMQITRNFAERGKRAVMLDCDLRNSHIVGHYGVRVTGELTGLVHYLAGLNRLEEVLYQTNIENFYLLPAGRDIANPMPLLDSPAFAELLNELADRFDMVVVDAPPVGLVIDAAEIARHCDGIVLAVKYRETHRRELSDAKHQLEQTGTPILGCVLNDVSFESISAKKYYNRSYYSHYGRYYRKYGKYGQYGQADNQDSGKGS